MSSNPQQPHPIDADAVTPDRTSERGRPWGKGTRLILAMASLIVLDAASRGMSSGSDFFTWSDIPEAQLPAACLMSLAVACVIRILLVEIHLTYLRCDLDRRQKGESWSLEGALALSIYPTLSLWLNSSGWTHFASTIHVLTVLSVCLAGNSATQLIRQIQRFSPGFSVPPNKETKQRLSILSATLPAILIWNLLPIPSAWSTRIWDAIGRTWLGLCRRIIEQVALPDSVDLLSAGLTSASLMISLVGMSIWMSFAAPLVLSVLVHAHLSQQQGQRLARVRELMAGFTWMALCLGLVGPQAFRCASSLIALLCLAWLNAVYNLSALEAYLRRMRQLR